MDKNIVQEKMQSTIKFFEKELSTLRTSRANPSILDNLSVDAYGSKTPINQLGNINVPESNMITIQVWDSSLINEIEKSINESNLGINPQVDGQLIRLPIPKLSEERRKELAKLASQHGEQAKIAIRNNRRDFMEKNKKDEKDKKISQDESKKFHDEIQKITDEYISQIEKLITKKQEEILKV
tara:strand:- start:205 stop:753 length:549 start_codon:yes stop_codon:yes gene_type:complete